MSIMSTGAARDPGFAGKIAYTIVEAAAAIGSSRSALYLALKERRLSAKKIGSRTIITGDELKRYIATLPTLEFTP